MPSDLGQIIAAEVGRAESDYQQVRVRALSIVGVAGGLVALITGLLAIAVGAQRVERLVLPGNARWSLVGALVAFVLATICALLINLPQSVTVFDVPDLRTKVQEEWDAEGIDKEGASLLVDYLESLRKNNCLTAWLLTAAISFQIVGIAGTATTAALIIGKHSAASVSSSEEGARQHRRSPSMASAADSPHRRRPAADSS